MCVFDSYPAATAILLHLRSFREEVNNLVVTDWPDSAICINALAPNKSIAVKSRFVANG